MATVARGACAEVSADYDRAADVLYVSIGSPVPAEGEDFARGLILRYSMSDDSPVGATIIGAAHNLWLQDIDELSDTLAKHLKMPKSKISSAILGAINEGG